ncbi:phytanoyl-CoA dioxygenase family protein [Mycobacterium sp. URHB0044]|jgi:ectoine hydroxylase-related dioxygenase (phytanoyl-CoA dioxygenase family)|uniref:phytanoyl-CoA dioxygenase family protein n=1 Tax=Mycobacterium sp. URHB0044 TaxID=1380386 RepID=UPI00068525BD|nr:phytanoyl-CoA dioxygenase family protein [Mycobacterium sp. URHB0044]
MTLDEIGSVATSLPRPVTPSFELTAEQEAFLPDDDDIAFYEANGYYITKEEVIPEALLNSAYAGIQEFWDGKVDAVLPYDTGYVNWKKSDGAGQRINEFISLQKRELLELATYSLLGAIAAKLMNGRSVRLLDDQLFYKPSGSSDAPGIGTGWHADHAYWGTCSSDDLTTAWVPFHDVPQNRSPLAVMRGSHRWKGMEHTRYFNKQNFSEVEESLRAEGHDVDVVPMILKRGQCSFHHGWTVHGSYPNTSGAPRLSYAAHYQDGGNRYRALLDPHGRNVEMFDEKLCRRLPNGDPDFSDPAVFPTVWSRP